MRLLNLDKSRYGILFLILLFLGSCTAKREKADIRYENGIKHIINPIPTILNMGKEFRLNFVKEFSIDSENSELVSLGLTEIIGFDVDTDGNIYILTSYGLDKFAHIFGPRGEYRVSFGRKGQGPGELQDPKYIELNRTTISILDFGKKKLLNYGIDGSYLNEVSIPPNVRRATLLGNKKIIVLKGQPDPERGQINFPVVLCDEHFRDIEILSPGRSMPILTQAKKINGLDLRVDYEAWQVFGESIYIGDSQGGYDIQVHDFNGKLTLIIGQKFSPVSISDEYKQRIYTWMAKNSYESAYKKIEFPSFFPAFQYFYLDEEGRIFVMTYKESKNINAFIYDIFNAKGLYMGRTQLDNIGILPSSPLKVPVPLKVVVKKGRIYYLHEKENGYKELAVCRMKWR